MNCMQLCLLLEIPFSLPIRPTIGPLWEAEAGQVGHDVPSLFPIGLIMNIPRMET